MARSLGRLGTLALLQGQIEGERLVRESIAIYHKIGDRVRMAHGFYLAGMSLMTLGAFDEAHSLLGEHMAVFKDVSGHSDVASVMQSAGFEEMFAFPSDEHFGNVRFEHQMGVFAMQFDVSEFD